MRKVLGEWPGGPVLSYVSQVRSASSTAELHCSGWANGTHISCPHSSRRQKSSILVLATGLLCELGHGPYPGSSSALRSQGTNALSKNLRTRVELWGLQAENGVSAHSQWLALWGKWVPNHYPLPYGSQLEPREQVQDVSQGAQETAHPCCASSGHFGRSLRDQRQPPGTTSPRSPSLTCKLVPGVWAASLTESPPPLSEHSLPRRCPDFWSPSIPFSQKEKPTAQPRSGERPTEEACPYRAPAPETHTHARTRTHTHIHTQSYLRSEHIQFGCNMPINGCPGEETIGTGAQGDLDKIPTPHHTHAPSLKHLPSTLQQGLRRLGAAAPASPPTQVSARLLPQADGRAGGQPCQAAAFPDRAPLCQQSYLWTYPSSPGERYLLGKAEPNDQVPPPTSR